MPPHEYSREQAVTLSVASYNIHGCLGLDRRTDPDRNARVMREFNTDIIALQEVKSQLGQTNDLRQLNYLAEATDLESIAGPTLFRADAPCGTALLTRCEVLAVRHFDLSIPGREPRGALDVDLKVRDRVLRIISTHLGLRTRERSLQVERLLSILPLHQSDLLILTGDINEWFPLGKALRSLQRYFGKSTAPRTFPSFLPLFSLDRLWVKRQPAIIDVTLEAYKTPLSRLASDHLPLLAKIKVSNGSNQT